MGRAMRRIHLFELEDQPWFSKQIRDLMTTFLRQFTISMGSHQPIVDILHQALLDAGESEIVDLCSGGGGLLAEIQNEIERRHGDTLSITFSDKFPNVCALADLCDELPERRRFVREPIDAKAVPARLKGLRTLFLAFHHFRPTAARGILASAVEARSGIAIFEVTHRSWKGLVSAALTPLGVWWFTPRIRPVTWQRVLFTYFVPIVPLFMTWDALVSALRTYTPPELVALAGGLDCGSYKWTTGERKAAYGCTVTYLIGIPY
jgi:hypothetical protein